MISRRALLAIPAAGLAPFPNPRRDEPPRALPKTTLLFGGDVMFAREVARAARAAGDPAFPLRELGPVLASADLTFVNLESPFSDRPAFRQHHMIFRAEPEFVAALVTAGVDVVSTANNHSRDCGRHGVEYTLKILAENGMAAVGTGMDAVAAHAGVVLERNGVRFGFLAYTFDQSNGNHHDEDPRIAVMDERRAAEDVALLRERADVVVVSMHAGAEYQSKPHSSQVRFARAVAEAGASVVAGHHPHVVQPVALIGKTVVFYSLGNLCFDQFHRPETRVGALGEVVFRGTSVERWSVRRVQVLRNGPHLMDEERPEFSAS